MTDKIFWRSALKASILMYFILTTAFTLAFFLFFAENITQLFEYMKANDGILVFISILLSAIAMYQVFVWVLFAFVYGRIPVKRTLPKVFLFNVLITGSYYILLNIFWQQLEPIFNAMFGFGDFTAFGVALFVLTTIMFSWFFDYFKKREEAEGKGEFVNQLASIPRRILAHLIDLLILTALALALIFSTLGINAASGLLLDTNISKFFSTMGISIILATTGIYTIYWTLLEGRYGASIGKKLLKMKVMKENGQKIGYRDAFFRNIPKFFEGMDFTIDSLLLFVTAKKQRLFDKVARTVVVRPGLSRWKKYAGEKVGFLDRFVASLADSIVIGCMALATAVSAAVFMVLGGSGFPAAFVTAMLLLFGMMFVFSVIYEIYFVARKGQTPGRQLMNIKVSDLEGKVPIGFIRSAVRYIGHFISTFSFGVGYLWIIPDKDNQGWHDKFADTFVVRDKKPAFNARKAFVALLLIGAVVGMPFWFVGASLPNQPENPATAGIAYAPPLPDVIPKVEVFDNGRYSFEYEKPSNWDVDGLHKAFLEQMTGIETEFSLCNPYAGCIYLYETGAEGMDLNIENIEAQGKLYEAIASADEDVNTYNSRVVNSNSIKWYVFDADIAGEELNHTSYGLTFCNNSAILLMMGAEAEETTKYYNQIISSFKCEEERIVEWIQE